MQCVECEYIFVRVQLYINKHGKLKKYKIIDENVCGKKISKQLEACFMEHFENMEFPDSLRKIIIETMLGTGLEC